MRTPPRTEVPNPPGKPLVVYDGDCPFCSLFVTRWRRRLGEGASFAPSQETARRFPTLPHARFEGAVQLIEPDGSVYQGAEAVFRIRAHGRRGGWLWVYLHVPGARAALEAGYRWVAGHRSALYPLTRRLLGQKAAAGAGRAAARPGRRVAVGIAVGAGVAVVVGAALIVWHRRRGL